MKKLLFLLLLFASCDKNQDSDCWVCQKQTVKSYAGTTISDNTVTFDRCNMTTEQAFKFENDNTVNYIEPTMNNVGTIINVRVSETVQCKQK